jgi:CrcB protein
MPNGERVPYEDDDVLGLDPEVEPAPDASHPARPTLPHGVLVAAGGALGTLGRDLLVRWHPASPNSFPWTLAALNVAGAALLGLLVARVLDPHASRVGLRLFMATGFLGGFTTYSSLVSAAVVSGHDGCLGIAIATLLGTAVAGVLAAWLGMRRRVHGAT